MNSLEQNDMKTPEIRAFELYKLVHGKGDAGQPMEFHHQNPALKAGWIKLGKTVLRLEARIKNSTRKKP